MGVSLKPRYKSFAHTKVNLWNKGLKKLNRRKWAALKRNRGNDNSKTLLKIPLRKMFAYKLESKQALKKYYGKIGEKQFKTLYSKSEFGSARSNISFPGLLERRLDALVRLMQFSLNIFEARQNILHGHFEVDGKTVTVPSFIVKPGSIVRPSLKSPWWDNKDTDKSLLRRRFRRVIVPRFIEFDHRTLSFIVVENPSMNDIHYIRPLNLKTVREHYL